jgi:hypothetical protein
MAAVCQGACVVDRIPMVLSPHAFQPTATPRDVSGAETRDVRAVQDQQQTIPAQ